MKYVLGFMFSQGFFKVVMIRKSRPAWQKGLLNGVGGKIEPGETPVAAMCREFKEETGVRTSKSDWSEVLTLKFSRAEVCVFAAEREGKFGAAETITDEAIEKVNVVDILRHRTVNNISFLIPLAVQRVQNSKGYPPQSFGYVFREAPDLQLDIFSNRQERR